jgi:hypothetical protein
MLQINKSQQACAYGWLKEVHNMKTTFTNAPCYKSLSADHMIKIAEKHQALSIFFKRASPLPNKRHWYIQQEITTPWTECDHN